MLMTMTIQSSMIVIVIFIVIDDQWGLAMTSDTLMAGIYAQRIKLPVDIFVTRGIAISDS
jgi:hypothetical protein